MIEQDLATPVDLPSAGVTPSPPMEGSSLADFGHAITAADKAFQFDGDMFGRQNALSEAADRRNWEIQRKTGVQLENPLEGGYRAEARDRLMAGGVTGHIQDVQLQIHQEKLDALAEQFPDHAETIGATRPLLQDARQLADYWQQRAARGEPGLNAVAGLAASFIGGFRGFLRNPLNVASLAIGGGELKATSTALRIAEAGLRQGAVNAGLQAVAEPGVQAWRGARGQEAGLVPALKDIGEAGLFGAVPGAGIEAAKVAVPALRGLLRGAEADRAAFAEPPPVKGLQDTVEQAMRHGEGISEALPEMPAGHPEPIYDRDALDALAFHDLDARAPAPAERPASERVETQARELSPKVFARADELDNRMRAARAEMERAAQEAAAASDSGQVRMRIADLEQQLATPRFAGKRRASPAAQALRDELQGLRDANDMLTQTAQAKAADQIQALRLYLNDMQNERARLGPKLRAVRDHAAGMLGLRLDDAPIRDPFAAADRLRADPRLVESALASDAPDLRAAGRLASLGDAAFEEARSGRADLDTALATAARVTNEAEQLAVMRGASVERPRGPEEAAAAVTREMEARATPVALASLRGAEDAPAAVPKPKFQRDVKKAIEPQIEALTKRLEAEAEAAAAAETPAIEVKPKRPVTRANPTLFEALAGGGGLAPNSELAAIFDGNPFVPGFGRLMREKGMRLDDALRTAKELGYFFDPAEHGRGELTLSTNDLLDKLREEAQGRKVYRLGFEPPSPERLAQDAEMKARHKEALKALKATPELKPGDGWTPDKDILDRAAWLMAENDRLEPLAAWDRAAVAYERDMRALADQLEPIQKARIDEHGSIPGWDEELPTDAGAAPASGGEAARAEGGAAGKGGSPRGAGEKVGGDGGSHREVSADPLDLVPGEDGRLLTAEDILKTPTREEMIAAVISRCPF